MADEKTSPFKAADSVGGKAPNDASDTRDRISSQRAEWETAKQAFGRQALEESLKFMRADNELVGHCNVIMAAVAKEIAGNPSKFLHGVAEGSQRGSKVSAEDIVGGQGGFLGEILDFIKEDKKFFLELVAKLLPF